MYPGCLGDRYTNMLIEEEKNNKKKKDIKAKEEIVCESVFIHLNM